MSARNPPRNGETYIALGDSKLSNESFNQITIYEGPLAWMDEEMINTGLEALFLAKNCQAHNIGVINTNVVQVCDASWRDRNEPRECYNYYRGPLKDHRWIILPINDGSGGDEAQSTASGTHWSLVIMDRIHKRSFYYDSYDMSADTPNYKAALRASQGLLLILEEDFEEWRFVPQNNCPHQWQHNTFGTDEGYDAGPCGPFVLKMCSLIIDHITKNKDESWVLLDNEFTDWFGKRFNSVAVRGQIRDLIVQCKEQAELVSLIEEHDQTAIEGEDVVVCNEPLVPSCQNSEQTPDQDDDSEDGGIALEDSELNSSNPVDPYDEGYSDITLSGSDPAGDTDLDESPRKDVVCFEDHQHRQKRQKRD
jgi:hypothetical protein